MFVRVKKIGGYEYLYLVENAREGDALVVWKLDRLSRSLKDLLHILEKIEPAWQQNADSIRQVFCG